MRLTGTPAETYLFIFFCRHHKLSGIVKISNRAFIINKLHFRIRDLGRANTVFYRIKFKTVREKSIRAMPALRASVQKTKTPCGRAVYRTEWKHTGSSYAQVATDRITFASGYIEIVLGLIRIDESYLYKIIRLRVYLYSRVHGPRESADRRKGTRNRWTVWCTRYKS